MLHEFFPIHKVYIQDLDYSCGPCAILNILNLKNSAVHYGEEEICRLCHTDRQNGTTPEKMEKGLRAVGLKIEESKSGASIGDIRRHLDQGHFVIVNYMHLYAGEGHYGVVTGYDDYALYLVDSSLGLIRLDNHDFEKAWHDSEASRERYLLAVS
jgi:predicted double-glycine peptidase